MVNGVFGMPSYASRIWGSRAQNYGRILQVNKTILAGLFRPDEKGSARFYTHRWRGCGREWGSRGLDSIPLPSPSLPKVWKEFRTLL